MLTKNNRSLYYSFVSAVIIISIAIIIYSIMTTNDILYPKSLDKYEMREMSIFIYKTFIILFISSLILLWKIGDSSNKSKLILYTYLLILIVGYEYCFLPFLAVDMTSNYGFENYFVMHNFIAFALPYTFLLYFYSYGIYITVLFFIIYVVFRLAGGNGRIVRVPKGEKDNS